MELWLRIPLAVGVALWFGALVVKGHDEPGTLEARFCGVVMGAIMGVLLAWN